MSMSRKMRAAQIGENIRAIRKKRGMTMQELADAANVYADDDAELITAGQIGRWERGENRIYADQIIAMAQALHCTGSSIAGGHSHMGGAEQKRLEFLAAVAEYPADAKEILWFLSNAWDGNLLAMIYMLGMYAMTPEAMRMDGSGMIVHQYQQALEHGVAGKEIHPDMEYVEKCWAALAPRKAKDGLI